MPNPCIYQKMVVPLHPNCESQIALRKLRETQIVYYECITNRHQHGAEFLQQVAAEILFAIRSSQALAK